MKKRIILIALIGMSLVISAQDQTSTHLYINGVDNSNTIASTNQLKVSGYGIMGNRSNLYFTNGNSNGLIKFGIGGVHNSRDILVLKGSDKSANFEGKIQANSNLYINGVDNSNTIASTNQLKVSGYGIMGNRSNLYFTNGNSNGLIKFGIGGAHNSRDILVLKGSDKSANFEGKVTIGTESTGSHRLAVEGSIGAREIKVEANGWSDFVFKKDYNLPTLIEVEKHINEKGHLKDIPSAKEVEKNGIFLGEMDSKLLQKIEELTLYTIAQEKKINNLEKDNKSLKTMNSKLLELQKRLEKLENK
jgi:hypothetical protein